MLEAVVAAFIGAVLGSLGAVVVKDRLSRKAERRHADQQVVEQYLLQFQNAVEALYYRFVNIEQTGGRRVMTEDYYRTTTLYALGSVLAYEQILVLDGVYVRMRSMESARDGVRESFLRLNNFLDDGRFFRYHRLALAESLVDRHDGNARLQSYISFRRTIQSDLLLQELTQHAIDFVVDLEAARISVLREILRQLVEKLSQVTKVLPAMSLERVES